MASPSSFDSVDLQVVINGHLYQPSDIGLFRALIAFEDDGDSGVELHCLDNDYRVADGVDFQPGQVMAIRFGLRISKVYSETYGGFVIQKPSTEYGEDGVVSVVKAYTKSGLLAASRPQKVYNKKTLRDIVLDVASRANMTAVWKDDKSGLEIVPSIAMATWSDRQLLSILADRYGYQVSYLGENILFDKITYSEVPTKQLLYRKGEDSIIKSASISMDAKKDAGGATTTSFDPKKKKPEKEKDTPPEMELGVSAVEGQEALKAKAPAPTVTPANSSSSILNRLQTSVSGKLGDSFGLKTAEGDSADSIRTLLSTPATMAGNSSSHATAFKFKASKKKCGLKLDCVLLPWAAIRQLLQVEGLAKRDSGNWYVSKVSHEISKSGCTTSLELNRSKHNAGNGDMSKVNKKAAADAAAGTGKGEAKVAVNAINGKEGVTK